MANVSPIFALWGIALMRFYKRVEKKSSKNTYSQDAQNLINPQNPKNPPNQPSQTPHTMQHNPNNQNNLNQNPHKNYKPKNLSRRLVAWIFGLIVAVQSLSILISAVFLHQAHREEQFSELEQYANKLAISLEQSLAQNLFDKLDSPYRVSVIALNGEVIFDNRLDIASLDNHLEREEVQNLMQGRGDRAARLSDSELRENLYFARFVEANLDSHAQSRTQTLILRISEEKDSLFVVLKDFAPLFGTLLLFSAIVSVALGILLARKILHPIKNIDLSHPIRTNPYTELHIFMQRISKQKGKIKKQLKRIKQGKLRFELITQNMNEGFLVLDSAGNITQCNEKALQILRLTPNIRHINIFAFLREFGNAVQNSIDSGNEAFEISINEYFCHTICMPIFVKNNLKAIMILLFDKSAKRDILALRKEFSANVTHELKTPLSVILTSSEMLCSGLVQERDKDAFIAKIYAESKRLLGLIDKILKISFLDNALDKNGEQKERVKLANVVKQILPSIENLAREKGVKCEFIERGEFAECGEFVEREMGAQEILGIPALLEDMVYNLCENAIKYSGKNGVVKIIVEHEKNVEKDVESGENGEQTSRTLGENSANGKNGVSSDNSVVLRVVDNGIGIALAEQERVFERFYCVDKSRSKKLGGNGLGLAIVKRIAKIHNAKISVHSELGKGSEFVVRFLSST
ncbi:ATP-binding protein [Helicobacter sp. 23-1048]